MKRSLAVLALAAASMSGIAQAGAPLCDTPEAIKRLELVDRLILEQMVGKAAASTINIQATEVEFGKSLPRAGGYTIHVCKAVMLYSGGKDPDSSMKILYYTQPDANADDGYKVFIVD